MPPNLQVPELAECLATSRKPTHEWLDLVVDTLMGLQVTQLSEGLVAIRVRALVGTFASVLSLMGL